MLGLDIAYLRTKFDDSVASAHPEIWLVMPTKI